MKDKQFNKYSSGKRKIKINDKKQKRRKHRKSSNRKSTLSSSTREEQSTSTTGDINARTPTCRHNKNPPNVLLDDNGFNVSNHVPPNQVLRSILHASFPILYLPEYISRRCTFEVENSKSGIDKKYTESNASSPDSNSNSNSYVLPTRIKHEYEKFLIKYQRKQQNKKDDEKKLGQSNENEKSKPSFLKHGTNTTDTPHQENDIEMLCKFVRVIIIPMSSNLISTVAYPINVNVNNNTSSSSSSLSNNDIHRSNSFGTRYNAVCDTAASASRKEVVKLNGKQTNESCCDHTKKCTSISRTKLINHYKQPRSKPKRFSINASLSTLVDGVISSLVTMTNNDKRNHKRKIKKSRYYKNSNEIDPISCNKLCYGRNVLSQGYSMSSSDEHEPFAHPNIIHNKRRKVAKASHCTNMFPGVQNAYLNSCASYARCSTIMDEIHKLVGDDLMREMLLHTIILIPVGQGSCDSHNSGIDEIHTIEKGNYFQLCGPPLMFMNLMARPNQGVNHYIPDQSGELKEKSNSNTKKRKFSDVIPVPCSKDVKKLNSVMHPPLNIVAASPQWIVSPRNMMYAETFVKRAGLPSSHVLNQCSIGNIPGSLCVEEVLLDKIVKLYYGDGSKKRRKRWRRIRSGGIDICMEIIQKHKSCDYTRLLERYCPLPDLSSPALKGVHDVTDECEWTLAKLIECMCLSEGVISFLRAVLKHVFPLSFWGSEHNFQIVLDKMSTFITLRRDECYPMKEIVKGIRVLDMKWLFHIERNVSTLTGRRKIMKSDHEAATVLVQNQMKWVFNDFIIPLIRSLFYATDTEFTGKQINYYRKPVWSKVVSFAIDKLQKKQLREISNTEAFKLLSEQQMGASRLRMLPKRTGVRPIVTLCKNEALKLRESQNIQEYNKLKGSTSCYRKLNTNVILKQIFDVLKFEHSLDSSHFGVGILGFHDVYEKFKSFAQELKHLSKNNVDFQLYCGSVDIKHCYDNIDQEHLLKIIKRIVKEDEYMIQQHTIMHQGNNERGFIRKSQKHVGKPGHVMNLPEAAERLSEKFTNTLVIDNSSCNIASKEAMLGLLDEHLSSHKVISRQKFGPKCYIQKSGIPQGSVLSSMLCNYYYGHDSIEKALLGDIFVKQSPPKDDAHLLVRQIDDFLIISTQKRIVQKFMAAMEKGIPHLGVTINKEKSRVSHELVLSPNSSECPQYFHTLKNSLVVKDDETFFPWCGLLINTRSCAVHVDYNRFVGTAAADSLTIDRVHNEGQYLRNRMKSFMKPRCIAIFYDTQINNQYEIHTNFYQVMAYAAVKTIHYVQGMGCTGFEQNVDFILECALDSINFSYQLICSKFRDESENPGICAIFRQGDAMWLGTHAWEQILSKTRIKACRDLSDSLRMSRCMLRKKSDETKKLLKTAEDALRRFDLESFQL